MLLLGKSNTFFLIRRSLTSSHRANEHSLNSLIFWKYQLGWYCNARCTCMARDLGKPLNSKDSSTAKINQPIFFLVLFHSLSSCN